MRIALEDVYTPSGDVVAREIEGEIIIVPLVAGSGDMEDELFTLNDAGKAIWDQLDGRRSLDRLEAAAALPRLRRRPACGAARARRRGRARRVLWRRYRPLRTRSRG